MLVRSLRRCWRFATTFERSGDDASHRTAHGALVSTLVWTASLSCWKLLRRAKSVTTPSPPSPAVPCFSVLHLPRLLASGFSRSILPVRYTDPRMTGSPASRDHARNCVGFPWSKTTTRSENDLVRWPSALGVRLAYSSSRVAHEAKPAATRAVRVSRTFPRGSYVQPVSAAS